MYEVLDSIADAVNPLTFIIVLGCIGYLAIKKDRRWLPSALTLFTGAVIAYGFMFLNNSFGLWPKMGLDYSTHTAVAVVLAVTLFKSLSVKWWPVVTLAYVVLMLIQKYHTVGDIVVTGIVAGGFAYLFAVFFNALLVSPPLESDLV